MQGIEVGFGFARKSANPIDLTLTLTKEQMVNTQDSLMPDKYFTICQDDGAIYLYDKEATPTAETGKFTKFEGGSGGTSDYNNLSNRPQINSVTLSGNKSLADLGITDTTYTAGAGLTLTGTTFATDDATDAEIQDMLNAVFGS